MGDSIVQRLDRRYEQLARQDDLGFVRQLPTYERTIDSDRRARRIAASLSDSADAALAEFIAEEQQLVDEAQKLRQRLVKLAPEIDNSTEPEPEVTSPPRASWKFDSLANFDNTANRPADLKFPDYPFQAESNPGRTAQLLVILQGRLHEAQYGPHGHVVELPEKKIRDDLDDFEIEIHNLQEKYAAWKSKFTRAHQELPGLAAQRVRLVADGLAPAEPFLRDPSEDPNEEEARLWKAVLEDLKVPGSLRRALAGEKLDKGEQWMADEAVRFLRSETERLHEELIDRLTQGEGLSHFERFRAWLAQLSLKALGLILGTVLIGLVGIALAFLKGCTGSSPTPTTETVTTPGPTATTTGASK